jgi:hypothetical protein
LVREFEDLVAMTPVRAGAATKAFALRATLAPTSRRAFEMRAGEREWPVLGE